MIEPWWPLVLLAGVQVVDAALCVRPATFVAACLDRVELPRRWWWVLAPIKVAAATGLVVGIWHPALAVVTCAALVLYFLLAVGSHVRARDWSRNLFVNASGMLLLSAAVLVVVLVSPI